MMSSWFIAYPIPSHPRLSSLPPPPARVRLVDPADLHLTVAFLGRIDETHARQAFTSLAPQAIRSIAITWGEVIALGAPRRPSALSALVEGSASSGGSIVEEIRDLRDALLDGAGLPADPRTPLPHVTLARIGRRATPSERAKALAWSGTIDLAGVHLSLDRLALYTGSDPESDLAYQIVEQRSAGNA